MSEPRILVLPLEPGKCFSWHWGGGRDLLTLACVTQDIAQEFRREWSPDKIHIVIIENQAKHLVESGKL